MGKIKVLIVENAPLFATEIGTFLHRLDYQIAHITHNSIEAIHLARTKEPDLIIMDIAFEGKINGVEVAEEIKDLQIPILFITFLKDAELYERAKKTNYVGYLIKPFDMLTLQSAIEFGLRSLAHKHALREDFNRRREDLMEKKHLLIKKETSMVKLPALDICYIQSFGNYCILHTLDSKKHTANISLVKIMSKLPERAFLRIHKQYVIQLNCLKEITLGGSEAVLYNVTLPVGRTYKNILMSCFETV